MKKSIVTMLFIFSMLSFFIVFEQEKNKELKEIENIETNIANEFFIPNSQLLANSDELYPVLTDVAKKYKVNIFRPSINYTSEDKVEILKYILLTNKTTFFNDIKIENGRKLNEIDTQTKQTYLSTNHTNNKKQIGTIKSFGNKNIIKIMPLKNSYEYLPTNGRYYVETKDKKEFHSFLEELANRLNKLYPNSTFNTKDFIKTENNSKSLSISNSLISYLLYIQYTLFGITLLFMIYYIFNESKKAGILKMHGISNIHSWFILIGKIIITIFFISTTLTLITALIIKNTTTQFIFNVIIYQIQSYIPLLIVSLVVYLYISKLKIIQGIKNKKNTNTIFIINSIIKIACSIILILFGTSILKQYSSIKLQQENIKKWEHTKDYGIFYPLNVGYDQEDIRSGQKINSTSINDELYPILNKSGSILINTKQYEEEDIRLNQNYNGIRSIKVNNNYLKEFPIYNNQGDKIQITEDTKDWILLVPEKYQNREQEIINFFTETRNSFVELQTKFYQREVPNHIKNQQIKIIWSKNKQEIFSFNPEVFKSENNIIIDPIIEVITEKNSLTVDRNAILGGGATDPLKVKLINRNTESTYKELQPTLENLKLNDNLKHLITTDQFILQEIHKLQKEMNIILLISTILLIGLLILITQNLIIFFNKNQQKYTIYRLFGIGFFKTYKNYSLLFIFTWIFQLIICFIIKQTIDIKLLIIIGIIMIIEIGISIIALTIIEKKNKIKTLKGG